MSVLSSLSLRHGAPLVVGGSDRCRGTTYDEKGDGGDDRAVVGRGKAGVHLADSAGLV
jgi:hypothetical protein